LKRHAAPLHHRGEPTPKRGARGLDGGDLAALITRPTPSPHERREAQAQEREGAQAQAEPRLSTTDAAARQGHRGGPQAQEPGEAQKTRPGRDHPPRPTTEAVDEAYKRGDVGGVRRVFAEAHGDSTGAKAGTRGSARRFPISIVSPT
jgi:hypothetical protein